jgi:hypothetical protein
MHIKGIHRKKSGSRADHWKAGNTIHRTFAMVQLYVFNGLVATGVQYCLDFTSKYKDLARGSSCYWSSDSCCWLVSSLSKQDLIKSGVTVGEINVITVEAENEFLIFSQLHQVLGRVNSGRDHHAHVFGFADKLVQALKTTLDGNYVGYSYTVLHDVFGCTPACTVQCRHCVGNWGKVTSYKACDAQERNKHEVKLSAGICLNNACPVAFPMCALSGEAVVAHRNKHRVCKTCLQAGLECQSRCDVCAGVHHCCRRCPTLIAQKGNCVVRNECPMCLRRPFATVQGLRSHVQTCYTASGSRYAPYFELCRCGTVLVDDDHRAQHKPPKGKFCTPMALPAPAHDALPPKWDDDNWYSPSDIRNAAVAATPAPSVSVPAPVPITALPVAPATAPITAPAVSPVLPPTPLSEPTPAPVAHGPLETVILSALGARGDYSPLFTLTTSEQRIIVAKAEELQIC